MADDPIDNESLPEPDAINGNGNGETAERNDGPSVLRTMMSRYYMEYASYVIKERAIPHLDDGLKPVQRRILHSLHEMDDGKFHKVANVVGNTMKFHPHGDASIYDALVNVANKEFFIEKQGNFGNILTGDGASAARYIECRLSPLARDVLFNPEITEFTDSYDGRNKEPVTLPAKVPVLLMQGTEGIAVGMSTRILSHNFNELLDAQIAALNGEEFRLYPDFLQGATMDVSEYNDGNGRVRLRAAIEAVGDKKLVIREIPHSCTTETIIASIEDAAQKGKIKIASITDYTGETIEIEITLPRNVYSDQTVKALYAYTKCEDTISVNCLVIHNNRPVEMTVTDCLRYSAEKLKEDLRRELEIELGKLNDQFHAKTLAQIFIENRVYKRIEEAETYELVKQEVRDGLEQFRHLLNRDIADEDIERLLQIQIRRISLFDINKNRRDLEDILAKIEEARENLAHLKRYTIGYIKGLKKKYGALYPRRTRIQNMAAVNVKEVALTNVKVGHDRSGGYIGTSVRSEEVITCTEYDKLVILKWDGTYQVLPIPDKLYIGPVCAVFKADKDQVYSMIYRDRKSRVSFAKRFRIDSYIMEKEYGACPKGSKVEKVFDRYGVVIRCEFEPKARQRVDHCELDFEQIPIRGARARGLKIDTRNILKFLQVKRGSDAVPDHLAPEDEDPQVEEPGLDEDVPQPDDATAIAPGALNLARLQRQVALEHEAEAEKRARAKDEPSGAEKPADRKPPSGAAPEPEDDHHDEAPRFRIDDGDFELES